MDPVLHLSLRASLSLLMAVAAWHKASDPARFRATLEAWRLLPASATPAVAVLVPVVEASLSAWLLSGVASPLAGAATASLLLLYAAGIQVNVMRGRADVDCGCAGPAMRVPIGPWLVVRNVVVAVAAAALLATPSARPLAWLDAFSILAFVATSAAAWSACERMLALAPRMAAVRGGNTGPAIRAAQPARGGFPAEVRR